MNSKQEEVINTILDYMENPTERKKTRQFYWSHYNGINGNSYRGINAVLTSINSIKKGFEQKIRMTFNQAKDLGWHVKSGEKGTTIFFQSPIEVYNDEGDIDKKRMTKLYSIFNIEQINDINTSKIKYQEDQKKINDPIEEAENIANEYIKRDWVKLIESTDWSCNYSPSNHKIAMVNRNLFDTSEDYYETLYHELVHSTGKALWRVLETSKKKEEYAIEELVAEFGSAMLLAGRCKMDLQNKANYLAHRASKIRNENLQKEVYRAIQRGQKAYDYVMEGKK